MLLLADQVPAAVTVAEAHAESWGDPAGLVLPYLYAAGSAGWGHPRWKESMLRTLLTRSGQRPGSAVDLSRELDRHFPEPGAPTDPVLPPLGTVLVELAETRTTTTPQRATLLNSARTLTNWQLDKIVGGTQRSGYGYAAQLAVALSEAQVFAGGAFGYWSQARGQYPRHSAFHQELDKARKAGAFPT